MTTVDIRDSLVTVERTRCVWGHQASCQDCGWVGEGRLTRTGAVTDGLLHFCNHPREDHPMSSTTCEDLRTSTLYRVGGHAGLWYYRGPAVVVTDSDTFEHDGYVLMAQAADPDNIAVVEPTLVSEFVVADTEPVAAEAVA